MENRRRARDAETFPREGSKNNKEDETNEPMEERASERGVGKERHKDGRRE